MIPPAVRGERVEALENEGIRRSFLRMIFLRFEDRSGIEARASVFEADGEAFRSLSRSDRSSQTSESEEVFEANRKIDSQLSELVIVDAFLADAAGE
jgi:hypothetical protein